MDNIINTLNLEKFNNFIPYIGDTKYLIIIFGAIFLTIFILITILTKKNTIKKNNDVRKQPNLDDIIDKRDIKVSDDNEFVDVLVAIEEEMMAIRELYVGGYISKGVYISEIYLSSLENFYSFTKDLIEVYLDNNICPVIETEFCSQAKLEDIYTLLKI